MTDRAVNLESVIGVVNTYFRSVLNLNPDLLIDGITSLPTVAPVVRCRDCEPRIVNLVSVMAEAGRCNWYRMMVFAIREKDGE